MVIRNKSLGKIFIGLLGLVSVIVFIWVSIAPVVRNGDANEYFFQMYQFSRHCQLSGSKMDVKAFGEWFAPVEKLFFDVDSVPEYPRGNGFTRVGSRYFTHHFGFYSILASGPAIVLRTLGLNEHRALILTNGILFVAMLWGMWFLMPFHGATRVLAEFCVIFSPAVFYLSWAHTEVYLFSFIMLSLVSVCAKRVKLSMLFASIASMQNQTLGLYLMALALLFLKGEISYWREAKRFRFREWAIMFLAGLPSIVPIIYYLVHLSNPSLLGGMDATSASFMSLQRALSVLIDLNQGLVVSSAAVVVCFFYFLARRLVTGRSEQTLMAVVALLLCYAVTSIGNWNSDCNGVMRYATWIYCFLLTFVIANLETVCLPAAKAVVVLIVMVITCVQFFFVPKKWLELRDVSRFVWDRFPVLYSPDYDIFMSRLTGKSHATACNPDSAFFGMYFDSCGNVRKVLATFDNLISKRDEQYVVTNKRLFESIVQDARYKPSKLRYFNFPADVVKRPSLEYGKEVKFSKPTYAIALGEGFSVPEPWGVWSTSTNSKFCIQLPRACDTVRLIVEARSFVRTNHVNVYSGDCKLAEWDVIASSNYNVDIPSELTGGFLSLRLEQDSVISPHDINPAKRDRRTLGIGLVSIRLEEDLKK